PRPRGRAAAAGLAASARLALAGAAGPGQGAAEGGGDSALADALREVLPPPLRLVGDGGRVGTVRRRLADGELHLLANTGPTRRTLQIAPRTPRGVLRLLDPGDATERALPAEGGEIELHPYQAVLLLVTDQVPGPAPAADASEPVAEPVPGDAAEPAPLRLEGPWTVAREGEEPRPVTLPHLLHGADAADRRPLLLETVVELDEH